MNEIETSTPPPAKRPYHRRLANMLNVKSGLGDVIRKLESGELDPRRGNALVYAYSTLASVLQGSELSLRLERLEAIAMKERP